MSLVFSLETLGSIFMLFSLFGNICVSSLSLEILCSVSKHGSIIQQPMPANMSSPGMSTDVQQYSQFCEAQKYCGLENPRTFMSKNILISGGSKKNIHF